MLSEEGINNSNTQVETSILEGLDRAVKSAPISANGGEKAIDLKISILPKDDFDSDASQDNSMMSKEKR